MAQWVDEPAVLYTNIRLRHQRNKTTVGRWFLHISQTNYNGGIPGDCSQLLSFRNIGVQAKTRRLHASFICYHARLVKVKNVSADVERTTSAFEPNTLLQVTRPDHEIRFALNTYVARRCRRQPCRLIALPRCPAFPIISGRERSGSRLKRLLSCVGMSKPLERPMEGSPRCGRRRGCSPMSWEQQAWFSRGTSLLCP